MSKSKMKKLVFSNKGSALIMAILCLIVMSLIGSAVIALTVNNFQMSVFYSDTNKAYYLAESGIEKTAAVLDERIAKIQENARKTASSNMQSSMQSNPTELRTTEQNDGSVNYDTLSNKFELTYYNDYYEQLNNEFANLQSIDYRKKLLGTLTTDGQKPYLELDDGKIYLENISYNAVKHSLSITTSGEYNEYKKTLNVVFSFDSSKGSPYHVLVKEDVKKRPELPDIFSKAVAVEKNIISAGGTLTINGDVIAFGTVPTGADGKENKNANSYTYGGIVAGLNSDFSDQSKLFGFDTLRTGKNVEGSININGNAVTAAYLRSMYGNNAKYSSNISITGNCFSRYILVEKKSGFAVLDLNNVYTIGSLEINSKGAKVNIAGKYYGITDADYAVNSVAGSLDMAYRYTKTSSVVVNDDSELTFNDMLYIGGTSFFDDIFTKQQPYISGISVMKTTDKISSSYSKDGTKDTLFWNANGIYTKVKPYYTDYLNSTGKTIEMIEGREDKKADFSLSQRAFHFKGLWDNLWKNDNSYKSYVDTENIKVVKNGINKSNKLRGYSNGAVIANGGVYGIEDFEGGHAQASFHDIQIQASLEYHKALETMLIEKFDANLPQIDCVKPSKSMNSLIDPKFNGANMIISNSPYISANAPSRGMIFYGAQDTTVSLSGGVWRINDRIMPSDKGIIFVDGNLYIDKGFKFKGIIMTTKNVIALGDADISYDRPTVLNMLDADVNTKGFFKLLTYDIPDLPLERQRITTKTFDITQWKEITDSMIK